MDHQVIIPARLHAEISSDGSWQRLCRVGLSQHLTRSLNHVQTLPHLNKQHKAAAAPHLYKTSMLSVWVCQISLTRMETKCWSRKHSWLKISSSFPAEVCELWCWQPLTTVVKVVFKHQSHHCNNWSWAHVGHQSAEKGLTPQFTVMFPEKVLRCLYKHTQDRLMFSLKGNYLSIDDSGRVF